VYLHTSKVDKDPGDIVFSAVSEALPTGRKRPEREGRAAARIVSSFTHQDMLAHKSYDSTAREVGVPKASPYNKDTSSPVTRVRPRPL